MKKTIYVFGLMLLAGAMVFTACKKDDDDPAPIDYTPVLTFIGGTGYVATDADMTVGSIFKAGINASENATSKKNIETFKVVRIFNNVPVTVFEEDNIGDPNYTWEDDSLIANAVAGEERWTFTVTDKDGVSKEISFIITTTLDGSAVLSYSDLNMGSYDDSDYGSFMATIAANIMKKPQAETVQALVDIIFFWGSTNGITFGAPSNATVIDIYQIGDWDPKNNTLFMASGINSDDFDAIGDIYAFPSFTGTEDIINQLSTGDVIYFKTVTDKLGYIRINSHTKDGFEINIDMKIME